MVVDCDFGQIGLYPTPYDSYVFTMCGRDRNWDKRREVVLSDDELQLLRKFFGWYGLTEFETFVILDGIVIKSEPLGWSVAITIMEEPELTVYARPLQVNKFLEQLP